MIVFHAFAIDDNNGCIDPQQYKLGLYTIY